MSDSNLRTLVAAFPGSGWDFGLQRHPYFADEAARGARYTVYNRRLMAVYFEGANRAKQYWALRTGVAVLHTGELPTEFRGPDAEKLCNRIFTGDINAVKPGRCTYGLVCYPDGGLLVDGVLVRLAADRFWYVQADGDLRSWLVAHSGDLDVEIFDPGVFVSQVQGPRSLDVLRACCDDLPDPFGYFAAATVTIGGQRVVITRTGYTNELGWEFYTESGHDARALWSAITAAGADYDLDLIGLDAMDIRRIEAGILNAGSDFDATTTPYDVGLGRFVNLQKADFIGKDALAAKAGDPPRFHGLTSADGQPQMGARAVSGRGVEGVITASAWSPYLACGIGYVRFDAPLVGVDATFETLALDASPLQAELQSLPLYDKDRLIPRGKLVDIPEQP